MRNFSYFIIFTANPCFGNMASPPSQDLTLSGIVFSGRNIDMLSEKIWMKIANDL